MPHFQDFGGVYLDHNATTPPAPVILENLLRWAKAWGNPSSIHKAGRGPKALIRESRGHVAAFLGASPLELVFTSCGSESNNLVLKGVADAAFPSGVAEGRCELIVSQVEHPALLKTALDLERRGFRVHLLPVNREGHVDLETYKRLLSERTLLVSCMLANNETGSIFPVKKMARLAHEQGALFHTDATQGLGKMRLNVTDLEVDFATFSGHKFYALRGVGVLFIKRGSDLHPQVLGGGQERHRRSGTENVLAIASLGEMCKTSFDELEARLQLMRSLRDEFEARVLARIPGAVVNGAGVNRLANTSSITLAGIDGETLLMSLDMKGFAVSTGAACSSGSPEPSVVLRAMGLSLQEAQGSLRVSLGWETTPEDMRAFAEALEDVVARLRLTRERESYGI